MPHLGFRGGARCFFTAYCVLRIHRHPYTIRSTQSHSFNTLDYHLAVEVIDLVSPRGSRRNLAQQISGTINGAYNGMATFEHGDIDRERDIDRAVTIIIEDGEATLTVNGEPFAGNGQTGNVGAS